MKSEHAMIRRVPCDATLACEELEPVIAPQIRLNHNETFLAVPEGLEDPDQRYDRQGEAMPHAFIANTSATDMISMSFLTAALPWQGELV